MSRTVINLKKQSALFPRVISRPFVGDDYIQTDLFRILSSGRGVLVWKFARCRVNLRRRRDRRNHVVDVFPFPTIRPRGQVNRW